MARKPRASFFLRKRRPRRAAFSSYNASILSCLASLGTTALSRSLAVLDHLVKRSLRILHQRRMGSATFLLCALLLMLIDGLRCLCLWHLDFAFLGISGLILRALRRPIAAERFRML